MLMVYTGFPEPDKPEEITEDIAERVLGDGRFHGIFHKQSYGKLKLDIEHVHGWRTMPRSQEKNDPSTTEGHRQMFVDIFAVVERVEEERSEEMERVVIGVLFQLDTLHLDGGLKIINVLPLRIDLAPKFGDLLVRRSRVFGWIRLLRSR